MASEHDPHAADQDQRRRANAGTETTGAPPGAETAEVAPAYPPALLGSPHLEGRGNAPVRASLLQQAQGTYGNRAVQRAYGRGTPRAVQRQPPAGGVQFGAPTPGVFDPTNVSDPLHMQDSIQKVLDQEERDVSQWIETNTDNLSHYVLSGRAALVFMVKTGAPAARAMPEEQINRLLNAWATKHKLVIPAISMFGPMQMRTIAAPDNSHSGGDDAPHLGVDLAGGGGSYTITAVWRNLNAHDAAEGRFGVDILHEPNVSVQIQPDPKNPAVVQAAIALLNAHLRRHKQELIEASLGVQGSAGAGGTAAGVQAQVELHLSTSVSITASTSLGAAPHSDSPPDPSTVPLGTRGGVDFTWQPIAIGTLIHFD